MPRPKRTVNNEVLRVYETLIEEGKLSKDSAGHRRYQELKLINSRSV